jgi:hypothetical protein
MPGFIPRARVALVLIGVVAFLFPTPSRSAAPSFLDGLSLVVVDAPDIAALHAARERVQADGGRIAVMVPPSLMIGWVEPALAARLTGQAGIREVRWSPVTGTELGVGDEVSVSAIETFNAVVSGEYARRVALEEAAAANAPSADGSFRGADGWPAPPIDEAEVWENLRRVGIDPSVFATGEDGPNAPGPRDVLANSDRMTGTVAVTFFLVESDGSGSDPDSWTWTPEDMQFFMDATVVGLAWWSARAAGHRDCWLTFVVNHYSAFDPRCQQWVEPVLHNSGDHAWIQNVITEFGYTSGSIFSRVNAFNTWQRTTYQTNWSYSSFICYNPTGAPSSFADGGTAAAWLYGPYFWSLYRTGWAKNLIVSHESGHIFGACDEYAGGCSDCTSSCSIYGTPNANCEVCNPNSHGCMMRSNEDGLCQYTKGMIGWDALTPCAPNPPAPLPAPTISSTGSASGLVGTESNFTVMGGNFVAGVEVDLGPGAFVHATTLVSPTALQVWVSVFNETAPGLVDVVVRNRDGQSATLVDGFEILPTRVHYFSPSGGDVFPYLTPATAGNTLADVMNAAADGDTVRVPTMTFPGFTLGLARGITLQGAWDASFTTRDLVAGKTVLDLATNIDVYPGVYGAGLDGFILEGGDGRSDVYPWAGYFGGAIRVLNGGVRIAHCEIRNGVAGPAGNASYGGALFAHQSSVEVIDCSIHDNAATRGGAIFLQECSGTISGCTISSNHVVAAGVNPAEGSGVYLLTCTGVTISGTTFDHHGGGQNGGALLAEGSTGVTVQGGLFAYNTTSLGGGGITFKATQGTIDGVLLRRNSSLIGGAIQLATASSATVSDCRLEWNTAILSGALTADGGTLYLRHNQMVGNSSTFPPGAVGLVNVATGSVAGNVFDRSSAGSGVGALNLASCPIEVFNNVVTHTTGAGVGCSGTAPTLMAYNDVFDASGGAYSGCSAGTGSLAADPVFADTAAGDYHLGAHSPCIDSGRPGAPHDDPDASRGDMGRHGSHAFAMDQPAFVAGATVFGVGGSGGALYLRWSPSPEGDVVKYAVYGAAAGGFIPDAGNFLGFVNAPDTVLSLGTAPAPGTTYYRVNAIDADGYAGGYSPEATLTPATPVDPRVVYEDRLHQNVPNPFNPATEIRFDLARDGAVALVVYDVSGRAVRTLARGAYPRGEHVVRWDGRDDRGVPVSTGVYFYRLDAGRFSATRKTILLK